MGLFYNKAMLKAAGLQPPTTWDELAADAKKLTKPPVYGMAFDATADEQSTCQLEPFFWSNGASLTNVDQPSFESALQLWVNMVKDGSSSKSVLQWGQSPDLAQQFTQKQDGGHGRERAVDLPPAERGGHEVQRGLRCDLDPVREGRPDPDHPARRETWNLGKSGSSAQQTAAWNWIKAPRHRRR